MEEKTNVMRILDQKKIKYIPHTYQATEAASGTQVAQIFGMQPERVFKTLVTVGKTGVNYCFVVPVDKELNLKKAAQSVKEKSIEMIKSKELLPLTGYVHGGCSPIGMKKPLKTVFDNTAVDYETILFSAGKIGCHVEVRLSDLDKVIRFALAEITD